MRVVKDVQLYSIYLPVTRSFNFSSGTAGKAGEQAPLVFVKITDSEGEVGWGQCRAVVGWSYETHESVVSTISKYLAAAIDGISIFDHRGQHARMNSVIGRGPSLGQPIAKSAVDMALFDLASRAQGLPLRCYLGGAASNQVLDLSWTCTATDESSLKDDIQEGLSKGMKHYNFKAGYSREIDREVATCLKAEAPNGAFIWADANQGLNLHDAVSTAKAFVDIGVDVLEQPLPADQLFLMEQLRSRTPLPLAVDEASVGPADFFSYASRGLVDYLILKVTRSGGIWPSMCQIAVMESAGLKCLVSGLADGLLTKLAATQVAASIGISGPLALNGSQFIDESAIFPDKATFEHEGSVHLGDNLGIGTAPDEAALAKMGELVHCRSGE